VPLRNSSRGEEFVVGNNYGRSQLPIDAIEATWQFAIRNSALLVVPALGFALSVVMLRIKKEIGE
jgi:hypothetical protein